RDRLNGVGRENSRDVEHQVETLELACLCQQLRVDAESRDDFVEIGPGFGSGTFDGLHEMDRVTKAPQAEHVLEHRPCRATLLWVAANHTGNKYSQPIIHRPTS